MFCVPGSNLCLRFVCFLSADPALFSTKPPFPVFGKLMAYQKNEFSGKHAHKLFVCVCSPWGKSIWRVETWCCFLCETETLLWKAIITSSQCYFVLFLPSNIFQESNTGGVYWNNVQCQAYYSLYLYHDASIHWLEVRMSVFFWDGKVSGAIIMVWKLGFWWWGLGVESEAYPWHFMVF